MKIKNLTLSIAPLVACLIITIIGYFAAFAITVMIGNVDVLDTETAVVNQGIFNAIRFMMIIILCGWWYKKSFSEELLSREASISDVVRKTLRPWGIIPLILLGFSIQLTTDAVLFILSSLFRTAFASYDHMMETFQGSTSALFTLTVCTVGPIAEELVFRGLTLGYARRIFSSDKLRNPVGIIIQALLFGIYHGNIIQSVYAFIFGILFGIIAVKTESLIPSIVLHIIVNTSYYLIPSDIFQVGARTSIILAVSFTVLVVSVIVFIDHFDRKPSESDHPDNH